MVELILMALVLCQDETTISKNDLILKSRAQAIIEETQKHKAYLEKTLESTERRLTAARRGKVNRKSGNSSSTSKVGNREIIKMQFSSREAQQEVINELTAKVQTLTDDIKSIDERTAAVFPSLSARLGIGDFGVFFGNKIYVLQIIDEKTMRAELRDPRVGINKNINVMVRDFGTAGMVDNQAFVCDTVFEVTGTETYQTAIGGTQTVFVLKPLNTEPILDLVKAPKK